MGWERRIGLAAFVTCLAACGGGGTTPDGGDGGSTSDAAADAGPDGGPDLGCVDEDSDGHGAASCGGDDCDDHDGARYPGNTETCDRIGHDEDCDPATLGPDADGDGFAAVICCNDQPGGAFLCGDDCNDASPDISPTAPEACNFVDDDCDGLIDEAGGQWRPDCDRDGYGDTTATLVAQCASPVVAPPCPGGVWTQTSGDCNDANEAVSPAWEDVCNGFDDDCNGMADDEPDATAMCSLPNAVPMCSFGACQVVSCTDPYLDCDGRPGCETDPRSDAFACDTCGHSCGWACNDRACDDAGSIAVSDTHSCVVTNAGFVECWGKNLFGELGDGTFTSSSRPVRTPVRGAVQVAATRGRTCVVLGDGTVQCWGLNSHGERGDDMFVTSLVPLTVAGITDGVEVSMADYQTCVRRSGGGVVCFGFNPDGQLGDGTTTDRTSPVAVVGLTNAAEIDVSNYHTCARRTDGTVTCWGRGANGVLGDGTSADHHTPTTSVSGITTAVQVALGGQHGCVRLASGQVQCWGTNDHGQLGNGTSSFPHDSPVVSQQSIFGAPSALTDATDLSAGGSMTCITFAGGADACTGENTFGSLGDGTTTSHALFTGLGGTEYPTVHLAAAGWHACTLGATGLVQCWGTNGDGQVGDGTTTDRLMAAFVLHP